MFAGEYEHILKHLTYDEANGALSVAMKRTSFSFHVNLPLGF